MQSGIDNLIDFTQQLDATPCKPDPDATHNLFGFLELLMQIDQEQKAQQAH